MVKFREKQIWPFAVASAAFLIAVAAHLIEIFRIDRGVQLFALDDAYIHAAIAKNLLLNHTFGISAGIFASASSSIIWPFLIAALFYVFGLHAWAILLFNIVLGIIALLLCHTVWRSFAPVATSRLFTAGESLMGFETSWGRARGALALGGHGCLYVCCSLSAVSFSRRLFASRQFRFPHLIVVLTVVHCLFGSIGWGCRYEAYLVELCLLASGLLAAELREGYARTLSDPRIARRAIAIAAPVLLLILLLICFKRIYATQTLIPQNVKYIYEQQMQTARFLARYYDDQSVAVNDIGVVGYLRKSPILDFSGLGSTQVTRLLMAENWNSISMQAETQRTQTRVVAVYDNLFKGKDRLPASWIKVAEWTIPSPPAHLVVWGVNLPPPLFALAGWTVSFYAANPDEVDRLASNMQKFAPCLPSEVQQRVQGKVLQAEGACPWAPAALNTPTVQVTAAGSRDEPRAFGEAISQYFRITRTRRAPSSEATKSAYFVAPSLALRPGLSDTVMSAENLILRVPDTHHGQQAATTERWETRKHVEKSKQECREGACVR